MEEQKKKFHGSREAGTFRERPERRENRFGERRESRFGERRESRFGEKREFKPRREGGYERREGDEVIGLMGLSCYTNCGPPER